MKRTRAQSDSSFMAACVAPEDLKRGDYVSILNVTVEFPSFLWCCESDGIQPDEPVRIQFASSNSGEPLQIREICLPFVFVKSPTSTARTIDIRQAQLVRLNKRYAAKVWNQLK